MSNFKKFLLFVLLIKNLSIAASMPNPVPVRHSWHPSLVREVNSQVIQNAEIDYLKFPRIVDDRQLNQLIATAELVQIPEDVNVAVNLHGNRTYVRYWTRVFLAEMGDEFYKAFGQRLRVNSAVRTREQQAGLYRLIALPDGRLRRVNRYAAAPDKSAHTSGTAVDLAKRNLTRAEYRWVVSYLTYMRTIGVIAAQEEPQCFHVAVLQKYGEYASEKSLDKNPKMLLD